MLPYSALHKRTRHKFTYIIILGLQLKYRILNIDLDIPNRFLCCTAVFSKIYLQITF